MICSFLLINNRLKSKMILLQDEPKIGKVKKITGKEELYNLNR